VTARIPFHLLERAGDERNLLKVDPRLDPLRGDTRFAELLKKMGF